MSAVSVAEVVKAGRLAARLERTPQGVEFRYASQYLADGLPAVASTLPLTSEPILTPAGAVPPFFAGLLPEGRRLTALRRTVKTSADDELSLLAAIGTDTIGDVTVAPAWSAAHYEATLEIDKSFTEVRFADLLAGVGIATRPTFAGVQDKVSAAMISLPVSRRHERFILKLNPPENPHLVENEAFFIELAHRCRIPAVTARLVHDADGAPGLLVTRFDRINHNGEYRSLAVEDACQTLARWPGDKYAVSMEEAAASLMNISAAPIIAARDILRQIAFAWLTGNGDQHAKNLSVVMTPQGKYRMSPAYDLPSTLFYGDNTIALTIGGKETLTRKRLTVLGMLLGLPEAATERIVGPLLARTFDLPDSLRSSSLPFESREKEEAARQLATRHRSLRSS